MFRIFLTILKFCTDQRKFQPHSIFISIYLVFSKLTTLFSVLEKVPLNITTMRFELGETARLSCRENKNSDKRFSWWKDGEEIKMNSRRKYNKKKILLFKRVSIADRGIYICKDTKGKKLKIINILVKGT